jgi:hypothetical protein
MAKQKTSASFTKDTAPKTGRKPGTKNRSTQEMRDLIQMLMDKSLERLVQDLDLMSPKNRCIGTTKVGCSFPPRVSNSKTSFSAPSLPFKNFPGDVSAQLL